MPVSAPLPSDSDSVGGAGERDEREDNSEESSTAIFANLALESTFLNDGFQVLWWVVSLGVGGEVGGKSEESGIARTNFDHTLEILEPQKSV